MDRGLSEGLVGDALRRFLDGTVTVVLKMTMVLIKQDFF
jgi:hypothetical protein